MSKDDRNILKGLAHTLSAQVLLEDIPLGGVAVQLQATDKELLETAERLEIDQIDELEAQLFLQREIGEQGIKVEGTLRASLEQLCVVTLEPLEVVIDAGLFLHFSESAGENFGDWEVGSKDENPPEMITEGIIDLGEAVVQQLALELDPFPRAPGVAFKDVSSDLQDGTAHPFSGLAALQDKLDK